MMGGLALPRAPAAPFGVRAALRGLAGIGCLLAAGPVAAAVFSPPQGCTLTMTVQQQSCTVSQHYTCAADPPGDQWAAYFTPEGLAYRARIDVETRWLESTDLVNGITDRLDPEARDPASLHTLLADGRDDFDFWTVSDTGERLHHVGHDELTGETVIDGLPLQTTRFALKTYAATGELLLSRTGVQYVSRETGRFYGGRETADDWLGETDTTDDTPVRFIRPGQPGFGSTQPQYGCNTQMAGRVARGDA